VYNFPKRLLPRDALVHSAVSEGNMEKFGGE